MSDWIVGIISGLISGVMVSTVFYFLAGRDLDRESKRLRHQTDIVLRGLEEAKLFKLNRNDKNEIVGLTFERRV